MSYIDIQIKHQQKVIDRLSRKIQRKNQKIEAAENIILHFRDILDVGIRVHRRAGNKILTQEYEYLLEMLDIHLDKIKENHNEKSK